MYKVIIILFGLIITVVKLNDSARILAVIPTPIMSHQQAFRPLIHELVKRGHDVVVVTTDPAYLQEESPKNLTEIDIHNVSYTKWREMAGRELKRFDQDSGSILLGSKHFLVSIKIIFKTYLEVFEAQMQDDGIQKLLKSNEKFDLLLLEAWTAPIIVFSHFFKAPVIQMSSTGFGGRNYETMAGPAHPLYLPYVLHLRMYNLTFYEKLNEFYNYFVLNWFFKNHEEKENELLKKMFGVDTPPINELMNNVDIMFLNEQSWDTTWPIPPSVIFTGGVHLTSLEYNPLPKDMQQYLDASKQGVIYVSFGTTANVNSETISEKIKLIVSALSKLSYNILLKWDADKFEDKPDNIKIAKWFPQFDILRHPNVKLFVTQGGRHSLDEALAAGVPQLVLPLLADQWYNGDKIVHHNMGLKLEFETLTENKFSNAVISIIKNESFRANVERLRSVMQDQPQSGLERAVWWTEYVLRHKGARHLRAPTANMTWSEFLELKLISILTLGIFLGLSFIFILLKILKPGFRRIFLECKSNKTKSKLS